jgi:flagella basal body P-ring formation protein FlgA
MDGTVTALLKAGRPDISAIRGAIRHQFEPAHGAAADYSDGMKKAVALARRAGTALLLALGGTLACAQSAPTPTGGAEAASGLDQALEQQVRALALTGAKPAAAGAPRVEVNVGQLDPRLRLAPCQHVEPYVPDGLRMWGKSRIGLRCTQGPTKWNVYLPITVRVFGTALVASNGLQAGALLGKDDLAPAEVDLAEDSSPPVVNADLAVGHTLTRAVKAGQSLRVSHLKPRQWFAAGETVTVMAQGDGFSVAGEAEALNPGIEGVPVRVRTDSGRVLTGLPVGERRVELGL